MSSSFFFHVQQKCENVEDDMWSLCPSYCLRRLDPVQYSGACSPDTWKNINNYGSQAEESDQEDCIRRWSYVSQANLLHEAQRKCPFMDVEDVFERYCLLTGCCGNMSTPATKQLICSIPAVLEGGKIQVQHCARRSGSLCTNMWTQVYAPCRAEQVMGNSEACHTLVEWLECWVVPESVVTKATRNIKLVRKRKLFMRQRNCPNQSSSNYHGIVSEEVRSQMYCSSDDSDRDDDAVFPSAVLLHGPHGCGKTAAVFACAVQLGLEVFEINTSSLRNKSQMLMKLEEATRSCQVRLLNQLGVVGETSQLTLSDNIVVLIDEVDVIFREDVGFLKSLQGVISSTKRPFVLTCSDRPNELFYRHVLHLPFTSPSESELGVHLSLLSLAHRWLVPLHCSCEWSRAFHLDIRRALLYMQWRLGWKRLVEKPCPSFDQCSQLLQASALSDCKATVDCVHPCSRQVTNVHQPWLARLQPSLLDQLEDNNTYNSASALANSIHQLLSQRQSPLPPPPAPDGDMRAIVVATVGELFPVHWSVHRSTLYTDYLPYLKLMYLIENQHRRNGSEKKIRRSRHYFHAFKWCLDKYFSAQ